MFVALTFVLLATFVFRLATLARPASVVSVRSASASPNRDNRSPSRGTPRKACDRRHSTMLFATVNTAVTTTTFAGPGDPTLESGASITGLGDRRFAGTNAGFLVQEMLGFNDRLFVTGGLRVVEGKVG